MIRIEKKIFPQNDVTKGIVAGKPYYVLNFRKGIVVSENFPDRTATTNNGWFKRLYLIDDHIYLFDATTVRDFKIEQNRIVDEILTLVSELTSKMELYPEGTKLNFFYLKRIEILNEWAERIVQIKPHHPLKKHLKKIRQQHPKLK